MPSRALVPALAVAILLAACGSPATQPASPADASKSSASSDGSSAEKPKPSANSETLRGYWTLYKKSDPSWPDARERWSEIEAELKRLGVERPIAISAATQENVSRLVGRMFSEMDALPMVEPETDEMPLYTLPEIDVSFNVEPLGDGRYRVVGKRIERAAAMTYWDYEEAVFRFQRLLDTVGVTDALRKAGVQEGDTVEIGAHELEWSD